MVDKLTPRFEVLADGSPLPDELVAAIASVVVRQDLVLADTIELSVSSPDLTVLSASAFDEGKKLQVKLGYVETDLVLVGTGTVARREFRFPERGPASVTVVAYDKRFALKQATNTRAWTDVKDSDVVSQLVAKAGLSGDVDDSGVKQAYLLQPAQTDLAFIAERASQLGFHVKLDREGGKLSFKKPKPGDPAKAKLAWGGELLSFRPRFATSGIPGAVTVRGYDMKKKRPVEATATEQDLHSTMGLASSGAGRASQAHGARGGFVAGGATSVEEAKSMAKAAVNAAMPSYATASGSCRGANALDAGCVVELEGVGVKAGGKYHVTATVHHLGRNGYTTFFECERPGDSPTPPPPPASPPPASKPADAPNQFQLEVGAASALRDDVVFEVSEPARAGVEIEVSEARQAPVKP